MRYELMLPHQIRTAIAARTPVVLPIGVLEYHGEHLGVGLDTIVVVRMLERLETERALVLLPAFYYGAASYAVARPEGNGSIHVDTPSLQLLAEDLFGSLLRVGFRNIHGVIHHQTENFAQGMPTDLAFRLAAKRVLFQYAEKERGEGWWGAPSMAKYYDNQDPTDDPFSWITIHPLMPRSMVTQFPFDHAGQGETSLLMHLCPEAVDMARFAPGTWYTGTAPAATPEFGRTAAEMILEHLRQAIV